MSETSSFHSALESPRPSSPSDSFLRFTPEEEAELIASSNEEKATANAFYASSQFSEAIGAYDHALSFLPQHLDYEIAVLKSNIAACHVRLAEWKEAVKAAEAALDGLERVLPSGAKRTKPKSKQAGFQWKDTGEGERTEEEEERADLEADRAAEENGVVELDGDEEEAARNFATLKLNDERREQVNNLRAKSWLRRARANFELGGWSNLASAEEDYKALSQSQNLPARDKAFVRQQLAVLGPRIQAAKEKDTAEMMGKLKELGNGILKPFGLSTDMFKFEKDEATGGYSMSMNQQNQ